MIIKKIEKIIKIILCMVLCLIFNSAANDSAEFSIITNIGSGGSSAVWETNDVQDLKIDKDYIYIIGMDISGENPQWRIEKRNKTDGELVSEFGNSGAVQSNPSPKADEPNSIALDDNYIYIGGNDQTPKDYEWRVEKRNKRYGELVKEFGTDGVLQINPSKKWDSIKTVCVDDNYLYLAGYDETAGSSDDQCRIEKRDKTTGQLVKGFGTDGVIQSNPSSKSDSILSISADNEAIYLAGYDNHAGNREWRIEKRDKTTGGLVSDFGTGGIILYNFSEDYDIANSIIVDSDYIFIAGYDRLVGDREWRIEKRDKKTGGLIKEFGNAGIVSSNPGEKYDKAKQIVCDDKFIYIFGDDSLEKDYSWRVEKRDKTTGGLAGNFADRGTLRINPTASNEEGRGIAVDENFIYLAGTDKSSGDWQWRIEKRNK